MNGQTVSMTEGGGAPAPTVNGAAAPLQAIAGAPVAQPVPTGLVEIGGQQFNIQPVPVAQPAEQQPAPQPQAQPPVQVVTAMPAQQPVQQQPSDPEAAPPTLGQRIRGATASKGQLVAERDGFRQRAEQAESLNQQLRAELINTQNELQVAQAELAGAEQALADTQQQVTTVGEAATERVAEAGFPAEELPAQQEAPVDSMEAIQARLADRNLDPKERFLLDAKLEQLQEEAKKSA